MTIQASRCVLVFVALVGCVTDVACAGQEPRTAAARDALALCREADRVPVQERATVLTLGLERAEEAVRADPDDAVAHFSVFCNLGKRLQTERGNGLGLLTLRSDLARAEREIDVTLALAPDYAPALAAKGAMLAELPRLLGGDREQAELLARRAVTLEPGEPENHLVLARILETAGKREEAGAHAEVARTLNEHGGRTPPRPELASRR